MLVVGAPGMQSAPFAVGCARQELRRRLRLHLYDESGVAPEGTAIYSLADPRDVRESRYVGQTTQPHRRLIQHVRGAELWLGDEIPWWVKAPRLRPLYGWIRELYQQADRLPVMIVHAWVGAEHVQREERRRIRLCLERQLPLLNVAVGDGDCADEQATT